MSIVSMTNKQYNDTLLGVYYLFKEHSPAYLKVKESQARYYQRNKERYIARQMKRYEDPELKEQIKRRAVEWNRAHKYF